MTNKFLCIVAMSLCSCSMASHPPNAYHIRLDPNLSAEEVVIATDVAYEWSQQTGFTYDVNISSDKCGFDLFGEHGCMYLRNADPGDASCPWACDIKPGNDHVMGVSSEIKLHDISKYDTREIRHEMGHALGLYHDVCSNTDPEGTAMCPKYEGSADRVTPRDARQYVDVRLR